MAQVKRRFTHIQAATSLRWKILRLFLIILILLTTLLLLFSQSVLLKGFADLEESQLRVASDSINQTLSARIKQLRSVANDWSRWEDLYDFFQGQNDTLVARLLVDKTFEKLEINFFVLIDGEGRVHFQEHYNLDLRETVKAPDHFEDQIRKNRILWDISSADQTVSGLLSIAGRPAMIASTPVMTRHFENYSLGALLVGKYLDEDEITRFTGTTNSSLIVKTYDAPDLSDEFSSAKAQLDSGESLFVKPIDNDHIVGYWLIKDINEQPILLVGLNHSREIYHYGQLIISCFLFALLAAWLIFTLVLFFGLEREILTRVDTLYEAISHAGKVGYLPEPIKLRGSDELTELANLISQTFLDLNYSRQALKTEKNRLWHESHYDVLTGFPNRLHFLEYLKTALEDRGDDHGSHIAILFIDIDRFKLFNESYDHTIGDQVLTEFSRRLKRTLRTGDVVARFGGDEFTILLESIHNEIDAVRIAMRIQQEFDQPFQIEGKYLFVSVSLGIALSSPGIRPEDLIRNADMAMNRAKANGKNCFAVYNAELHQQSLKLLELENELRAAIENHQFSVYYQPIILLKTGEISGFEALVRWNHPQRGLVLPGEFIPIAEETGLILPINEMVIETALSQLASWHQKGFDQTTISVNIPVRQLRDPDFVPWFISVVEQTDIKARFVQIEIVESAVLEETARVVEKLSYLRKLGFNVSLDDFGTGYSSLAYLSRLPVNCLKIDRSFVQEMTRRQEDRTIVRSIIAMAQILGMDVIAEGVENKIQLIDLMKQSCPKAQGFYFLQPAPAAEITKLLEARSLSKPGDMCMEDKSI